MKCVLVWLAVTTTTFHISLAQCQGILQQNSIVITVRGVTTPNSATGCIEVCIGGQLMPVCADNWGEAEARIACRQLGFNEGLPNQMEGGDSCLSATNVVEGPFLIVSCDGNETQLMGCQRDRSQECTRTAGISCRRRVSCPQCPDVIPQPGATLATDGPIATPPVCTCPPSPTPQRANTNSQMQMGDMMGEDQESVTCIALGGGLGGLCAILAILLVGVVMGWVWSCHRTTRKSRSSPNDAYTNPNYSPTTVSHTTSVQYSAHGPRGTPVVPSNPTTEAIRCTEGEERIYHVLEGPGDGLPYEEPVRWTSLTQPATH